MKKIWNIVWEWKKERYRNNKKTKPGMFCQMIFAVFLFFTDIKVWAAPMQNLNFADMTGSVEDLALGTVEPELVYKEEEGALRLHFETTGYQERYYTATAFKNMNMELEEYYGIEFHVVNRLGSPLRMNFSLSDSDGRTAVAGDGYYVELQWNDTEYAKVEYGCFELPAKFDGTVKIPFAVLKFQEGGNSAENLSEMYGYGLICVVEENESYDMELSELKLLEDREAVEVGTPCALMIVGEESALLPSVGESETYYSCVAYNMLGESEEIETEFFITGAKGTENGKTYNRDIAHEEAYIDESGCLTVTDQCSVDTLEIGARVADGREAFLWISLYKSWTNSINTENGYDASLVEPSKVEPIVTYAEVFERPKLLWRVREVLLAGAGIFMLYYLALRRKYRRRK